MKKNKIRFRFISIIARRLKIKENEIENLNKQSKKHDKIQYNKQQNSTIEYTTLHNTTMLHGWLEFNLPFQHKYGYIRDDIISK